MRGRRPLPTKVKELKGTLRKNRVNRKEPKLNPRFPRPPRGMPKEERAIWRQLAKVIDPLKVTASSDQATLELLVAAIARWRRAVEHLRTEGEYYEAETRQGSVLVKLHPAVGVAERAERFILRTFIEFGLTPAARSKVDAKESTEEDPKATILGFIKGGLSASG